MHCAGEKIDRDSRDTDSTMMYGDQLIPEQRSEPFGLLIKYRRPGW